MGSLSSPLDCFYELTKEQTDGKEQQKSGRGKLSLYGHFIWKVWSKELDILKKNNVNINTGFIASVTAIRVNTEHCAAVCRGSKAFVQRYLGPSLTT